MKIADGVEMLEIATQNLRGMSSAIYPTLVWDEEGAILVDTGYPGQLVRLREAVERAGVPFDRINRIILTHHDLDHIGGLASIRKALPGQVTVMALGKEIPYIQGDQRPLKLAGIEAQLDSAPEAMKSMYEKMKAGFQSSFGPVDGNLADRQDLPYCCGITVIHTPGHTLGHICLYLRQTKTLVAGDALTVEEGSLNRMRPEINYDNVKYGESLKKLEGFDVETVICYHGGLYRDHSNQRIAELAAQV